MIMNRIIQKLEQKIGIPGLVDRIAVNLSGSELNTFLLHKARNVLIANCFRMAIAFLPLERTSQSNSHILILN